MCAEREVVDSAADSVKSSLEAMKNGADTKKECEVRDLEGV